jgi:hypothetical protein
MPADATDVRFGSLADIVQRQRHVRFTPDSGHSSVRVGCPKSAISGHRGLLSILIMQFFSTEQPVVCGLDALLPHGQRRKRPFTNRLRLAFGRVLRRL